jgi:hypothetical protein
MNNFIELKNEVHQKQLPLIKAEGPTYIKKDDIDNEPTNLIWKKKGITKKLMKKKKKNPNIKSLDTKYLTKPIQPHNFNMNNLTVPLQNARYHKKIVKVRPSHSSQQSDNPTHDWPVLEKNHRYSNNAESESENVSKQAFTFHDRNSEKFVELESPINTFPEENFVYKKIGKISVKNNDESTHFQTDTKHKFQSMKDFRENMIISNENGFGKDFFESKLDVEDVNTNYNRYDQNGKPLTISGINNNLVFNKSKYCL